MWNDFVAQSKNATFLFNRGFMEYHSDRFEDYSLIVFKEDVPFALLPAHVKDTTIYSHNGLTYGSFALLESATLLEAHEAFKTLLEFLHKQGFEALMIKVIPTFYNTLPSDELAYFLFKANATLLKRDVLMVIDYQNQLPFKKNRRWGINKAKRNELVVKIDANFEGFWNKILIPHMVQKHHRQPVHSLEEIQLLASRFPNNIKQVNVYKGDEIVAGTTIFLTETTVHPQHVSGTNSKNSLGSFDLLFDFVINHFKVGRRYFDFNISSEENGQILNKGLLFWKETSGARSFTADNYLVQTASYKQMNLQLK